MSGYNGAVPEVPAVPLRDHFRPPANAVPFDGIHGGWPMMIVQRLFPLLPPGFRIAPQVQLGARVEFDIATYEYEEVGEAGVDRSDAGAGGTATLAPPAPTLLLESDWPEQDEYEVRVYDETFGRRLVAVVELVSPANKDRPDSRRAFVAKCAALLQQDVCVAIVDIVPVRRFNLYAELLELIGGTDPLMSDNPPTYAVTLRGRRGSRRRIETFAHVLEVGQPLPTLPLWLSADQWVRVELEPTYEETCRLLGVP